MGDVIEFRFKKDKSFEFDENTTLNELLIFSYELGKLTGETEKASEPESYSSFVQLIDMVVLPTIRSWLLKSYIKGVKDENIKHNY